MLFRIPISSSIADKSFKLIGPICESEAEALYSTNLPLSIGCMGGLVVKALVFFSIKNSNCYVAGSSPCCNSYSLVLGLRQYCHFLLRCVAFFYVAGSSPCRNSYSLVVGLRQ